MRRHREPQQQRAARPRWPRLASVTPAAPLMPSTPVKAKTTVRVKADANPAITAAKARTAARARAAARQTDRSLSSSDSFGSDQARRLRLQTSAPRHRSLAAASALHLAHNG